MRRTGEKSIGDGSSEAKRSIKFVASHRNLAEFVDGVMYRRRRYGRGRLLFERCEAIMKVKAVKP
jgi:hypothetical protein